MKKSELNCRDRYQVAEGIPTKKMSKKQTIIAITLFLFIVLIAIPLFGCIVNFLFPIN